jgi:EAL domain-containing protein (putative c-di-GMP-specific phosphodiesterase class I)
MVTDLDIKVYCEGIETEGQHQFVLGAVCHYELGFRFYNPMGEEGYLCLMGG